MKKLLLLSILFIVGCKETTEPESIEKHGCLDYQACNYDPDATVDNNSCKYDIDCNGICGGTSIVDYAGNCYNSQSCNVDDSNWYGYGDQSTGEHLGYNCTIDVNNTETAISQNGYCMCKCRYGAYGEAENCNGEIADWRTTNASCWWPDQCDQHCLGYCFDLIECPENCTSSQ